MVCKMTSTVSMSALTNYFNLNKKCCRIKKINLIWKTVSRNLQLIKSKMKITPMLKKRGRIITILTKKIFGNEYIIL